MFNIFFIYLRNQIKYFIFLLILFVLPLFLFFHFSSYPLPKVQYVFLGSLILSQYAFYNEKSYRRKVESKNYNFLKNELSRLPSGKEMDQRLNMIVSMRNGTIVFIIILIFLIMSYYGKL